MSKKPQGKNRAASKALATVLSKSKPKAPVISKSEPKAAPKLPETKEEAIAFIDAVIAKSHDKGWCLIPGAVFDIPGVAKDLTQRGYTFDEGGFGKCKVTFTG
jgi:hypothetical protein